MSNSKGMVRILDDKKLAETFFKTTPAVQIFAVMRLLSKEINIDPDILIEKSLKICDEVSDHEQLVR